MSLQKYDLKKYLDDFIVATKNFAKPKQYVKGDVLLKNGEQCRDLFIFHNGLGRCFFYNEEGLDVTTHFIIDYGIISAIDSLVGGGASRYNIEVIEPSKVSIINIEQWEKYLEKYPEYEKVTRKLIQALYYELADRVENMMFNSALIKYNNLTLKYPDITNRVNLGHIATFLGISQETLSRIRAQRS